MAIELDDDTLQRYYDGDLSPLEASAVRNRIEHDPEAQHRLIKLQQLSEMLGIAADEMGAGLDSAALFAGIQDGLKREERAGFGERLRVITGEWVEHKRSAVIGIVAVGAIAAAALFGVFTPAQDGGQSDSLAREMPRPREERKLRLAEAEPADVAVAPHGSQIENVDFGNNTGTVFEIENGGVKTAVVWIADEEDDLP